MKIVKNAIGVHELVFEYPDRKDEVVGEFTKIDKLVYLHLKSYVALTEDVLKKILEYIEDKK